ncbi:condensation domain-containing protein [Aureisphaera galaxeae]|uniref:condensation domain-containing protein n=1 Tax=Aureisphaera galaxeae TaxID=1538023 RepID=UPI0023507EE1|nr:condensation domain-containing protein [Aureisphaera galaxeae]MDC8004721.1 condensation domain-containing protein [Aureisphaera galaxeae]
MKHKVVHTIFENIVRKSPNAVALATATNTFTYSAINANANVLARVLRQLGVGDGEVVGCFCKEAEIQIQALLGIFKAKQVYLPLDEKYKANHWSVLYEKIHPKVLVTSQENLDIVYGWNQEFEYTIPFLIVTSLDENKELMWSILKNENEGYVSVETTTAVSNENLHLSIDGKDANYIFFTSGSTGKPKAVLGCHESLAHFIEWEARELNVTSEDRIGQFTSLSFDASLRDIFLALTQGACICIPKKETKEHATLAKKWLMAEGITILHSIPTMIRFLLNKKETMVMEFPKLRYLLLAGEKLYARDVMNWRDRFGNNTQIINLYGATESTLVKTFHRVEEKLNGDLTDVISVGKPISETEILILNEKNERCGINEEGTIYIKTPYLSKGYYRDSELTQQKFIQNPLNEELDIIYDTGDYGAFNPDGTVRILGRKDGLLKINGVRCDLNAIESTLLELEAVTAVKCVVAYREDIASVIICFYASVNTTISEVRNQCLAKLSAYEMVGLHFEHMEALPTNSNGKIDTARLNQYAQSLITDEHSKKAATTPLEGAILEIWKEVLDQSNIGTDENIFLLGGHSLIMNQLVLKYQEQFNVQVNLTHMFEHTTIAQHAELIASLDSNLNETIPTLPSATNYELSEAQNKVYLLSELDKDAIAYDMTFTVELEGTYDSELLNKALQATVDRHEITRTVFGKDESGVLKQWILPKGKHRVSLVKHNLSESVSPYSEMQLHIDKESEGPFNFEEGPLLKVIYFQLSKDTSLLYMRAHQLICDAHSLNILHNNIMHFYEAYEQGKAPNMPALQIQYKDFAVWHKTQRFGKAFEESRAFWMERLSGDLPLFELPEVKTRPVSKTYNGQLVELNLSPRISKALVDFSKERRSTAFIGILTVWNILFQKYCQSNDLLLGTRSLGRYRSEFENQVGNYFNTVVVRNQVNENDSFQEIFEQVRRTTLESFEHQKYYFDWLIDDLELSTPSNRNPIYDVMITYEDKVGKSFELDTALIPFDEILYKGHSAPKLDILITAKLYEGFIQLTMQFNTDIYTRNTIALLLKDFGNIASELLQKPNLPIRDIDLKKQTKSNLKSKNLQRLKAFTA